MMQPDCRGCTASLESQWPGHAAPPGRYALASLRAHGLGHATRPPMGITPVACATVIKRCIKYDIKWISPDGSGRKSIIRSGAPQGETRDALAGTTDVVRRLIALCCL